MSTPASPPAALSVLTPPTPTAAEHRAELLALLKQLSFRQGHFVLASGKTSPYYLDCRMTTLSGRGAFLIGRLLYDAVRDAQADAVGGMSLGADPIVSALLYRSAEVGHPLNGFLVRKQAKGHGTGREVEGHLAPWMRVVLVEDVVTTGGSTIKAVEAVRRACPTVEIVKILSIVDRNQGGREAFAERAIPYQTLFPFEAFLAE